MKKVSGLTREITQDEVCTYRNMGVVLLRGVLDLPTVNGVRRDIDHAINSINLSASGYNVSELTRAIEADNDEHIANNSSTQHDLAEIVDQVRASGKPLLIEEAANENGSYFIDTGVTSRIPSLRRFAIAGAAADIGAALLGSEQVRFFGDQIFVKTPGTREKTAFHQDATYFEIDGDDCCVLWVPVDPVTQKNGMMYVRGSHKDGKLYKPNVFISNASWPGSEGDDLPDIEANLDEYDVVGFDVEPGDVIVHHYKTIHGARGNLSDYQVRRALSVRYTGDDIRGVARPWAVDQLHLTEPIRAGYPLTNRDFPVVRSRRPKDGAAA